MKKIFYFISAVLILILFGVSLFMSRNDLEEYCMDLSSRFASFQELEVDIKMNNFFISEFNKKNNLRTIEIKKSKNPFDFQICFVEINTESQEVISSRFIDD